MTSSPNESNLATDALIAGDLFSEVVAVAAVQLSSFSLQSADLFPEELAAVEKAVPRRRHEFAAGRWCARRALAALEMNCGPIGVGPKREPQWPAGMVGSITHNSSHCMAVVARSNDVAALGVDLEDDAPLPEDLWALLLTPAERGVVESLGDRAGRIARIVFSAKESIYKAQYPVTHGWLDFLDVEIELELAGGRFLATFLKDLPPLSRGDVWAGRWVARGGLLMTAVERTTPAR